MQLDFDGRRVLVTGGSRGIGRGIVEAFLGAGARVAINGSTKESTDKAIAEIAAGDRVVAAPGSVATEEGCRSIVEAAVEGLGGLDVLVNNAGIGDSDGPVEKTRESTWDGVIDTNLKGVFFTTKHAVPHLRESKGNIVNVSSVMGMVGAPMGSPYGASKAGVISLTKSHALEFGSDIRVNVVLPGGVDTDMLQELAKLIAGNVEDGYKILSKDASAQKRIAHVNELAGPVLYLASDLASFVTGSVHVVDGGETVD